MTREPEAYGSVSQYTGRPLKQSCLDSGLRTWFTVLTATAGFVMHGALFSHVDLEERNPARHRLRKIRQVANEALASLDAALAALYTDFGRPSIPPERLIRARLPPILFSVRSEPQLMEQMPYNLMPRWFSGPGPDDPVWGERRP